MKKKLLFIFTILIGFTLVACKKDEVKPELIDLSKIKIELNGFAEGETKDTVTSDFTLPLELEKGVKVTWTSNNEAIKINGSAATVTRSTEGNVVVELTPTLEVVQETGETDKLTRDKITITILKLDKTPVVSGKIYHWMPNSIGADVTFNVNLFDVALEEISIKFNEEELIEGLDYEIFDSVLTIYSDFLVKKSNELGKYKLNINNGFGTKEFEYIVVDNPVGTSIPTKEIEVSDMGALEQTNITEPIAGAPELVITEVASDAGKYSYIEVFNNSKSKRNLKGHLIVFGNIDIATNQSSLEKYGLISNAMGPVQFYITEELELEPFETGIIWYIHGGNRMPWSYQASATGAAKDYDAIAEVEAGKPFLFENQGGTLSENDFRKHHGISDTAKVVHVRSSEFTMNNSASHDPLTGYGTPVWKGSGFSGVNSSVANRGVQILYIDQEKQHSASEEADAPEGSTYFKMKLDVINRDKDLYVNGTLDTSKIVKVAGRATINLFQMTKVYYNASNEIIGYDKKWSPSDAAGVAGNGWNTEVYQKIAKDSILSTALFYPNLDLGDDGKVTRWGSGHGMEYTIPTNGSHISRFVPRSLEHDYKTFVEETYAKEVSKQLYLSGFSKPISGLSDAKRTVIVPENSAYKYEINVRENSAGVTSNLNLGK